MCLRNTYEQSSTISLGGFGQADRHFFRWSIVSAVRHVTVIPYIVVSAVSMLCSARQRRMSIVLRMNAHGRPELRPAEGLRGWMWEQLQARTCCTDAWLARGWCCRSCGRAFHDYMVHVRLQEQFVRTEIPQAPSTISEASVETTRSADSDSAESYCSSAESMAKDLSDHSVRPRFRIDDSVAEDLSDLAGTHLPQQHTTRTMSAGTCTSSQQADRTRSRNPARTAARRETPLGKVLDILEKRGELENCGWIFCGQVNKEIHLMLRRRMEATTAGYWAQQEYIRLQVLNAEEQSREGCWSDDDG